MKKITLLFTSLLMYLFSYTQAPQLQWSKTYGGAEDEYAFEILVCNDGYLIAGHTKSYGQGNDQYDVYLVRIDTDGNVIWTKTYGGSQDEMVSSCRQTHDGGYILAGVTQSWGLGGSDGYILKVDSDGDSLWSKYYGGETWDQFYCGIPTVQQGYAFSGYSSVYLKGDQVYMVETDAEGDTNWTYRIGGDHQDYGMDVLQKEDMSYITVGHTWSEGDESQVFLVKTDKDGNWTWTKAFGGPMEEYARWIDVTDEPGYIIVGSTQSYGHGSSDFWLVNTNNEGTPMDNYTFGGSESETANGASRDIDGGILMAGDTWSFGVEAPDVFLVKATEEGDSIWAITWGNQDWQYAYNIKPTLDGGYIVIGRNYSVTTGDNDILVLKYGPQPMYHYVFQERHGLNKPIESNGTILDTMMVDLPPGSVIKGAVIYLDTLYHQQTFALMGSLHHLDDHMMLFNRPKGKGPNFIRTVLHPAADISIQAGKAPYTGIYYPLNILMGSDINSMENEWILSIADLGSEGSGSLEAWGIQIFYEGSAGEEEYPGVQGIDLDIYPNPCSEKAHLRIKVNKRQVAICELYSLDGRRIKELFTRVILPGSSEIAVNASDLPAGIYFIRFVSGEDILTRKIVVN
jgi:hypothetical protein